MKVEKGIFKPGRWAFFVKWKGYGTGENSWVDEPDFLAKEMIEQYWEDHPEIPGNPKKAKQRKSNASSTGRTSVGKPRKSLPDAEASETEIVKPTKRKSSSKKESEEVEALDVDEEEAPPKKKSKAAANKKATPPSNDKENGYFSAEEEAPKDDLAGHSSNAMDKYKSKKNWAPLIGTIQTVERTDDGALMVYFTTVEGARAISDSRQLAEKAPQKLIEFYETNLRWRGVEHAT